MIPTASAKRSPQELNINSKYEAGLRSTRTVVSDLEYLHYIDWLILEKKFSFRQNRPNVLSPFYLLALIRLSDSQYLSPEWFGYFRASKIMLIDSCPVSQVS